MAADRWSSTSERKEAMRRLREGSEGNEGPSQTRSVEMQSTISMMDGTVIVMNSVSRARYKCQILIQDLGWIKQRRCRPVGKSWELPTLFIQTHLQLFAETKKLSTAACRGGTTAACCRQATSGGHGRATSFLSSLRWPLFLPPPLGGSSFVFPSLGNPTHPLLFFQGASRSLFAIRADRIYILLIYFLVIR